ncbi:MAG: VTT domain-containing protein [Candidatus Aenigmatarchaeota archaeon]
MFSIQYPWKYRWKHRNLVLIFIATAFAVYIASTPQVAQLIESSGNLGYLGSFIAGFFFSSLFTVPPATVVLILLGKTHDPFMIALIGASGTAIADLIIFKFVKKSIANLSEEIIEVKLFIERYNPLHFSKDSKIVQRIKSHMLPILAGIIIASPIPDEIAIGMLGAANYSRNKMLVLAFTANFVGILVLAYLGKTLF